MDSLTQAALGAAIGGTLMGRRLGRKAVVIGAVLGTLPDLDVALDYGDAVANYTRHRGFSHSLFVLTGLGTLLAWLCSRFARGQPIAFRHWWSLFMACLITHPLLDAVTTYGTQLFWPLDIRPSAWPLVFIIDPIYSALLVVGILIALVTGRSWHAPAWALSLSCLYLIASLGVKGVVESRIAPVLAEHGLSEAPRLIQPTPFNILLWRVSIVDGDTQHETWVGLFDGSQSPRLESFTRGSEFEPHALALDKGTRLAWFAGPFLRYAVVPLEGVETLTATDLRLGFPGFHPFTFALAHADDQGDWQPIKTHQVEPEDGDSRAALMRLWQRLVNPAAGLCIGDFVEPRWRLSSSDGCPAQSPSSSHQGAMP
ncbi:metal-dependent hydrolase [Litchfieldella xinjiangensis]|uniref:metal-dependent hydrolase n=1 Tax=Litchfieldella xinjiangensis TaxID=1166948 RepID=UPI000694F86E|nr:metal-dependent hydrolase [Halomonas xinjiangensis]